MPNLLDLIRHFPPADPVSANRWFGRYVKSNILFGKMFSSPENLQKLDTENMPMVMCTNINVGINRPYDYSGEFRQFDIPVLILHGNDRWESDSTNSACAEKLAAEFNLVVVHTFEDSGHFFFMEEKEESLRVVRKFLEG